MTLSDEQYDRIERLIDRDRDGEDITDAVRRLPREMAVEVCRIIGREDILDLSRLETEFHHSHGDDRREEEWVERLTVVVRAEIESGRRSDVGRIIAQFESHADSESVARRYFALVDALVDSAENRDGARLFGRFRLRRELGKGAQGSVFLAEDGALDRSVALKLINRRFGSDGSALSRFRREAQALSRLRHPSIATVHEAGVVDGTPYIAMEYVDGPTIAAIFKGEREAGHSDSANGRNAPISIDSKLDVVARCARALEAAHRAGIIHRDVKPGNIVIGPDMHPVVLDFGLATIEGEPTITGASDFLGTPAYAAPECHGRGAAAADRRSDVWSLGATLYEWLTGRRPYEAASLEDFAKAVKAGPPPSIRSHDRSLTRDLAAVVATAVEPSPDRRYESAERFADDLECVRHGRAVSVRNPTAYEVCRSAIARNPVVASLLLALLLAMSVAYVATSAARRESARTATVAGERRDELQRKLDLTGELTDRKVVADLDAEESSLWPVRPRNIPDYDGWLSEALSIIARCKRYEEELRGFADRMRPVDDDVKKREVAREREALTVLKLRMKALEATESKLETDADDARFDASLAWFKKEIAALETKGSAASKFVLDDPADRLRHHLLSETISAAAALERADGPVARIRARLARAREMAELSERDMEAAWAAASARLAEDRRFLGRVLRRIDGLYPIGRDPRSKLEEFLELSTHEGRIPNRAPDGRISVTAETGIILVLLPGGSFDQSTVFEPEPSVAPPSSAILILAPFYISKCETTQGQWTRIMFRNPSVLTESLETKDEWHGWPVFPVENVSFGDCIEFGRRVSLLLPTDAQWSYAAKAGTSTRFFTGDDPASLVGYANVIDIEKLTVEPMTTEVAPEVPEGFSVEVPVGSFRPNAFGLHDVHGNVSEWCLDHGFVEPEPLRIDDGLFLGPAPVDVRLERGGNHALTAEESRIANRIYREADARSSATGVRFARPFE